MARKVSEVIHDAQEDESYWAEWISGDFVEELSTQMREQGISRAELAAKIGSSPAHITQVLRKDRNLTVRSMAKLAQAVNAVVRVHLARIGTSTRWLDVAEPASQMAAGAQSAQVKFTTVSVVVPVSRQEQWSNAAPLEATGGQR